jgi:PDZ domain-containing protein
MSTRFSHTPRFVKVLLTLVLTLPLVIPVNFVLINPGEGSPLFPKLLKVSSAKTYPADGQMFLLSIWVTNPETEILGYQVLKCWAEGDCVVVPRSVVYQDETDNKSEIALGKKEMGQSQSAALSATKDLFSKFHPDIDLSDLSDSSIKVSLKNTGGPSGGLIFALGLTELLTPENILRGRKIAATGTITSEGRVGAIGGVEEKIIAARRAGVEIIFISRRNCDEIPQKVEGVTVVAVSSLEEAYKELLKPKNSNFQGVRGCTNLDS